MKTKTKAWLVAILALIVVIGVLAGIKFSQFGMMFKAGKSFVPPPESVTSATVEPVQWESVKGAIGTVVAVHGVTLGAELPGTIRQIGFQSGASVKQGMVLVKLDTSAEEAELASAVADAELAKLNLERAKNLRQGGANSPADLDAAQARANQTAATVANLEAVIAKKTIRAPFDGRVAIRQVELGQVVSTGTTIASLQSVSPIHVDFWLPQQALAEVKAGEHVRLRVDIFPSASWDGEITTINPEVDVATRNVRVRATFQNADGRLRPGMFASVEVLSSEKHDLLVIPSTAVVYAPYGDSVFAIEDERDQSGKVSKVAHQRFVRVGERRGDFVAVTSGLNAGETVVSSGAFKLRNGQAVAVNNTLAPNAEIAPHPTEN